MGFNGEYARSKDGRGGGLGTADGDVRVCGTRGQGAKSLDVAYLSSTSMGICAGLLHGI